MEIIEQHALGHVCRIKDLFRNWPNVQYSTGFYLTTQFKKCQLTPISDVTSSTTTLDSNRIYLQSSLTHTDFTYAKYLLIVRTHVCKPFHISKQNVIHLSGNSDIWKAIYM